MSNSLSDTEEHFEFTPEEDDNLDVSKLSSEDSFRSNSSSSPVGQTKTSPFGRNSHLRQSFNTRSTNWTRNNFRRSTGSHNTSSQSNGQVTNGQSKRISANGHARQMFSPAGSRRSSFSVESDEMINHDLSLEDDVDNLTQKISHLERQVSTLSENQSVNDDRYNKVKSENASLMSKVHLLEEQLRDIEVTSEERRKEEERRFKETMTRLEREKSSETDQLLNRTYQLQKDLLDAKEEIRRYHQLVDKIKSERSECEELISEKVHEIKILKEELSKVSQSLKEALEINLNNERVIAVMSQQLSCVRSSMDHENNHTDTSMVQELERVVANIRSENEVLKEANSELQAQLLSVGVNEGRGLLCGLKTSLADELITLNEEQSPIVQQLRRGLKEQQEVNNKLRSYIDGILLNIVENYPQLLEVKPN